MVVTAEQKLSAALRLLGSVGSLTGFPKGIELNSAGEFVFAKRHFRDLDSLLIFLMDEIGEATQDIARGDNPLQAFTRRFSAEGS